MKTISIMNLKGGVGKSITAINIAHVLSSVHHKKVLLIDNDKQGNTSKFFGLYGYEHNDISTIMTERNFAVDSAIQHSGCENLDIITANMNLLRANKEVLLDVSRPQQTRLSKALKTIKQDYDFCIIDNAPDINMSVINALVATDEVLAPITVDKFAFDGLEQLAEQVEEIKEFNPDIKFDCCVTMFQRNDVNIQGEEWLKNQSKYNILNTHIRRTEKVSESTFAGKPLLEYSKRCNAAKDYVSLVDELFESVSENDTTEGGRNIE